MKGIAAFVLCATVILACAFALFTPKMSAPVDFQVAQGGSQLKDYRGFAKGTALINSADISASSAILCSSDGLLIYEKNADVPLPMASITKVMTAVVALEAEKDLSKEFKVPRQAVGVEGSSVYLTEGEEVTLEMLLYSVMLESANDAATALAIATGGSLEAFVSKMNEKAEELSMSSTCFSNPHGLSDSQHFTTARDYARLMSYALDDPTFCKIISTKKAVYPKKDASMTRVLTNHNRLLNTYSGMIGGKTGFTRASGRTLVTAAMRNGVTLICVTLNAPNDWQDHTLLFDKGFDAVKSVTFSKEELRRRLPVGGAENGSVSVSPREDVTFTVKAEETLRCEIHTPHNLFAPLSRGQRVGYVLVLKNGKAFAKVDLICDEDAFAPTQNDGGIINKIKEFFKGTN